MIKKQISRRRFIKTGLAWFAGTAASLSSGRTAPNKVSSAVSRTSLKHFRAIPTTCEQCPAGCGIIAYLDGDRLVRIFGNPEHPNNQGSICARGIAGINLVNDPERLLYPMKRIGKRGSDRWAEITWDEAYSILTTRIKEMIRSGRNDEFVVDKGQNDPLLDRFVSAVGLTHLIDRPALKNLNRNAANTSMTGSPFFIEDVSQSRTIVNFGSNPYSSHDQFIGIARRIAQNRAEKGARLITFDIRMSETAAQSDLWYPLKAGTDGIIALAMAKVIIDKGLADNDFIAQKANYPLSKIKHHLSKYTLEAAEKESSIKGVDIEQIAVEFATQKPSIAISGGGISDHENGSQNVRCVALLNWLVGNLEKKGGLFFPRYPEGHQLRAERPPHLLLDQNATAAGFLDLHEMNPQIDTYFAYLSNPAYAEPDCQSAVRFMKDETKVRFLVVMDTHLTETALLADMVLPAATYLESWGVSSAPSLDQISILNLKQPVVSMLSPAKALRSPEYTMGKLLDPVFQPRGKAKEVGNLCIELARRIGGDVSKSLPFTDTLDYITQVISSFPDLRREGGLNILKKQGLWVNKFQKENERQTSPAKKNLSQMKEIEIYSNNLMEKGHSPLPEYKSRPAHKEIKKNKFILSTFKSNLTARGTSNSKWIQEISHENPLWINKEEAKRLGIKNGNKVRVISSVGSVIAKVLITNRIHPGSVALAEGFGHTAGGNVAKARRFKSTDRDTNLIWWEKEGNGVNPNKIIERRTDLLSGGQASKDTVVRIEKI